MATDPASQAGQIAWLLAVINCLCRFHRFLPEKLPQFLGDSGRLQYEDIPTVSQDGYRPSSQAGQIARLLAAINCLCPFPQISSRKLPQFPSDSGRLQYEDIRTVSGEMATDPASQAGQMV